jgi:hypothetical protein
MFRIWSDVGLESISNPGATIQLSDVNNEVLIQLPDQTSKLTIIRFAKGNLLFDDQESVLGINGDKIEAYQKRNGAHTWIVEQVKQVNIDATEKLFTRMHIHSKPAFGTWPYDCERIIPCQDVPMQTCGCDNYASNVNSEKSGIVYNMDAADSEMANKVDFQSCQELKNHGVSISGQFIIDGEETYCNSWSESNIEYNIIKILLHND